MLILLFHLDGFQFIAKNEARLSNLLYWGRDNKRCYAAYQTKSFVAYLLQWWRQCDTVYCPDAEGSLAYLCHCILHTLNSDWRRYDDVARIWVAQLLHIIVLICIVILYDGCGLVRLVYFVGNAVNRNTIDRWTTGCLGLSQTACRQHYDEHDQASR